MGNLCVTGVRPATPCSGAMTGAPPPQGAVRGWCLLSSSFGLSALCLCECYAPLSIADLLLPGAPLPPEVTAALEAAILQSAVTRTERQEKGLEEASDVASPLAGVSME